MTHPTLADRFHAALRAALKAWREPIGAAPSTDSGLPFPETLPEIYSGWLADGRGALLFVSGHDAPYRITVESAGDTPSGARPAKVLFCRAFTMYRDKATYSGPLSLIAPLELRS